MDDVGSPAAAGRFAGEGGELKRRLADEVRAAMKARESVRLGALRLLSAAVKNREVEVGHQLSDEEVVETAAREVKRRREAIEAYERAGRQDRADRERREMEVLEAYLPAPLGEEELQALVEEAVTATSAKGAADVGSVMRYVMTRAKGRVDGREVQARVRRRLEA